MQYEGHSSASNALPFSFLRSEAGTLESLLLRSYHTPIKSEFLVMGPGKGISNLWGQPEATELESSTVLLDPIDIVSSGRSRIVTSNPFQKEVGFRCIKPKKVN